MAGMNSSGRSNLRTESPCLPTRKATEEKARAIEEDRNKFIIE